MSKEYVIYGAADMTVHRAVVADRDTGMATAAGPGERMVVLRYPQSSADRAYHLQLLGIRP